MGRKLTVSPTGAARGIFAGLPSGGWAAGVRCGLWTVVGLTLLAAYILWSGPLGVLPRPAALDQALAALGIGQRGSAWVDQPWS